MNRFEKVMQQLRKEGSADLLLQAIVCKAYQYWVNARCEEDFCVQHADLQGGVIIFGSWNRVQWRVDSGFKILKGYCTTQFIGANRGD